MATPATDTLVLDAVVGVPCPLKGLTAGPPSGYRWLLDLPTGLTSVAEPPGQTTPPAPAASAAPADTVPGRGSDAVPWVLARQPGLFEIAARLARPSEADAPARTLRVRLRVRAAAG